VIRLAGIAVLHGNNRFAQHFHLAVLIGGLNRHAHASFTVNLHFFDDASRTGDSILQMGDVHKARLEEAQLLLGHPVHEQAAQPGHRQHAVGENIRHAGATGNIEIDMDGVVIARGAGEQRQRAAANRRQPQRMWDLSSIVG
jgi:hypothetical protein